jgi:hypothetical protein
MITKIKAALFNFGVAEKIKSAKSSLTEVKNENLDDFKRFQLGMSGQDKASKLLPAKFIFNLQRIFRSKFDFVKPDLFISFLEKNQLASSSTGDKALLVKKDYLGYANTIAPRGSYPTLYEDIPLHIKKRNIMDGRFVNGMAPAKVYAGLGLNSSAIFRAWCSSVESSSKNFSSSLLKALITATIVIVVTTITGNMAKNFAESSSFKAFRYEFKNEILNRSASLSVEEKAEKAERDSCSFNCADYSKRAAYLAKNYRDIWEDTNDPKYLELNKQISKEQIIKSAPTAPLFKSAADFVGFWFALILSIVLGATGATMLAFSTESNRLAKGFRGMIEQFVDATLETYRHGGKESIVRWKYRQEKLRMAYKNYAQQVHFANNIDRSPTVPIGVASGTLEFRGHLLAPIINTQLRLSIEALLSHVAVWGGSGEGKSRDFYVPFVTWLLKLRKDGYPIAIYATDSKGAIKVDILRACEEIGIPQQDVLMIGTGPDEWRVDLLDGLAPVDLADILSSVAKQAGGSAGDSFWPSMATDLILQVSMCLQAAEYTPKGRAWMQKKGIRMYSIVNLLDTASNDAAIMEILDIMAEAMASDENYWRIAEFDNIALHSAINYLAFTWLVMVDATRDGIRANVRAALRGFVSRPDICQGFADGAGENILPSSEILKNAVKIINVSDVEHGSAGRYVSIMLKTLLFKQARAAQQKDPEFASQRLKWWYNPIIGEDTDKYAINVFLADEYQALITSSSDDSMADSQVWNVLRSAGIAGVVLSQSLSAYRMVVGDDAVKNIRLNWRSNIFLRSEDIETINYAKELLGKTLRWQTMKRDKYESIIAAERELGFSTNNERPLVFKSKILDGFKPSSAPFNFYNYYEDREINNFDKRFIVKVSDTRGYSGDGMTGNASSSFTKNFDSGAAVWRKEDQMLAEMGGASMQDTVDAEDIMTMGRGNALVFLQSYGGTIVDFVKLNAESEVEKMEEDVIDVSARHVSENGRVYGPA